ncbi:cytochrome P450 pisatin demethylase, partial [Aspergillus uvarum CBS 121591]
MTSAILLVVQFLLADLLAHVLYNYYLHPLARYPGPFLARITNIWRFASFLRGQHHLTEEKLHQRYGPIVRVAPNWLSFSQLPAFEAIYGFHKAIEKDDFYTFGEPRPQRDVSVFATQSNPAHRQKRRRMLGPALTRTKVLRYEPVIARHVAMLVARLEAVLLEQEARGQHAHSGQVEVEVNVAPLVHRFTLDVMLDILFGPAVGPHPYTDNEIAGDLGASIRYVSKMVWSYSLWPAFGWLMNTRLAVACLRRPRYNAAGAMVGLNGLMHRAAAAILGTPEVFVRGQGSQQQQQQPGIVESWLRVGMGMGSSAGGVADNHHQKMTPAEAVSEAFNLVFAGPGSMAAALTAVLYQLGLPEGQVWQEKLRAGAGSEALGGSTSMEGSSPSLSPPLELQAVIKETLRFRAPFPTAFPRVIRSGAEMVIPGLSHPLPAGTTVSASTYVLGRSREIWGEDADQWVPQRWLLGSADNDDDEESRRQMDRRFVAFSRGPRGCSGRDLASLILAKAVRAIVQRWRFSASAAAELRGASFLEMQYDLCQLQ